MDSNLSTTQLALIQEWQEADKNQKAWRQKELELRTRVEGEIFNRDQASTAPEQYAGTHYVDLNQGWRLKSTNTLDYKLTNKDGQTDAALEHFSDDLAALLVKWEPSLSVSNYKLLTDAQRALLSSCLTIRNSSPSIELIAPKVKV